MSILRWRHAPPAILAAALAVATSPGRAQTAATNTSDTTSASAPVPQPPEVNDLDSYFATWGQRTAWARATQPEWSSPIVTTTPLLEQRFRFDTQFQHSGNNTDTIDLDGGKGVDLIVGDTEEIQIAQPPYYIRTAATKKNELEGYNDWSFFRFKQRLLSSPSDQGNYIVSAWLQIGAPVGISKLTNHAWTLSPTLGFGKGWGNFDIQGNVGGVLPTAYQGKIGNQIVTNLAFQYHVLHYFWPQVEMNWTYYPDGPRAHLSQVYLTPGITLSRIKITHDLKLTLGVGYQVAVAPDYRAKPLLPTFDRAWIISTRLNF
ncbi:MAG TPA: hypothetical protein VMB71_00535 [Acetobacteraceae bacterium]|nr:hypothetical protein [Acetobacteraceae bacterium]